MIKRRRWRGCQKGDRMCDYAWWMFMKIN